MDPTRESGPLADSLLAAFARRQAEAEAYNVRLDAGEVEPPLLKRVKWLFVGSVGRQRRKKAWLAGEGRKKASLAWSLNEGVALFFWTGGACLMAGQEHAATSTLTLASLSPTGLFKVVGDTAQLCGPLVTRQIILFAQAKARHNASPDAVPEPHIGRGIGMAFGLLFLTILASVAQHQFFWRSMSVGALTRARLTAAIYSICAFGRRSRRYERPSGADPCRLVRAAIHLTQKERTHLSNGKLLAHLSTDVSRVDFCAQWLHAVWTAPIQLIISACRCRPQLARWRRN
jgi:ATP-binding cassette subfamily C (CFTR/MRP) protein 1